jgi:aspartyl-tRNA(Asn)/glutamyl-tRNA(Gln) amidotransferase subunit A
MYLEDAFTIPQAMAGIPAISVPCGFTQAQASSPALPIGLQIMGPQWGEEVVLRAAYAYEKTTEWHKRKPAF